MMKPSNNSKTIPLRHKSSDLEVCDFSSTDPESPHYHHHRPPPFHHRLYHICGLGLILLLLVTQLNVLLLVRVMDSPVLEKRRATWNWWPLFMSPPSTHSDPKFFAKDNHDRLQQLLVRPKSIISWTTTTDKFFQEVNITALLTDDVLPITKLHGRAKEEKLKVWRKTKDDAADFYIWEPNICFAAQNFLQAGSVKPHVLFTYMNENRGAFSMDVKNRTVEWDGLATHWDKWGCTDEEIFAYLDHPNTKAVFTTQHQSYFHPKVHSIPLGVAPLLKDKILSATQLPMKKRTQHLMINDNGWRFRANVTQYVMDSFARQRPDLPPLTNTYSKEANSKQNYVDELRISKFILAPSGLGWDCYRIWEALYMGAIPIIETYDRPVDAWRETLDDLPVLWVDHYEDVTPELLESEYIKIAARAQDYKYEKLTNQWWIGYFKSFFAKELAALLETRQQVSQQEQESSPQKNQGSPAEVAETKLSSHLFQYYRSDGPNTIPRILHFTYITPGLPEDQPPLPSEVQENIQEWQRLHPDWMVVLWDNVAAHREFPELVELIKPIQTMSWISNLIRYHALEKYGGIYLDVDIVPIRSLEPLRKFFPDSFTACEQPASDGPRTSESEYAVTYCEMVNNNVIGVPPHHPAMKDIIETTVANTRAKLFHFPNTGGPYELKTTGPPIWSKSVKKFGMTMLHASLFYPCNWNEKKDNKCRLELWKDQPHVYGMHEWKMSWYKSKSTEVK